MSYYGALERKRAGRALVFLHFLSDSFEHLLHGGESNPRLQLGKGLASSQPSCAFVVTSEQNSITRVCARFAQTFAQSKISRLILTARPPVGSRIAQVWAVSQYSGDDLRRVQNAEHLTDAGGVRGQGVCGSSIWQTNSLLGAGAGQDDR